MGRSAPAGIELIPSTAFFTSCKSSFKLVPSKASILIFDKFSDDVEDVSLMPSNPTKASSIRVVIPSSISSADAPG